METVIDMSEANENSGLHVPVSRPFANRPEPEYVDEIFEEEIYSDPEEMEDDQPETLDEDAPEPAAPRSTAPTGRKDVRTVQSRIPHRHAPPKTVDRLRTGSMRPRGAGDPGEETRPSTTGSGERKPANRNPIVPVADRKNNPLPAPDDSPPAGRTGEPAIPAWVVLDDVLKAHEGLPEGSLILGVQDDGKPLVLALDDASLGAVLITGDSAEANRKHLRAILASAEKLNSPELLQVDVISRAADGYKTNSSVLRRQCDASDPCVFEILGECLDEIEIRLRDDRQLPFRILFLDEIEELTGRLADDSLRFLRWMMRRGPRAGIWIFASIETARLPEFDSKTFRAFDLRLYGKIREKAAAERYTEISPRLLEKLTPGAEGCFKLYDDVIRFSIPEFAA
jgi:hypothetical protein